MKRKMKTNENGFLWCLQNSFFLYLFILLKLCLVQKALLALRSLYLVVCVQCAQKVSEI